MSDVEICNVALTELGEETLVSLDDNIKNGRLCKLHYPRARDELQASYRWNFCLRRIDLGPPLTEKPVYGFGNRFQLPPDVLRVWDTDQDFCQWRIEDDELITDANPIKILYSSRVEDTGSFSMGFRRTLELMIAARIAFPITRQPEVTQLMEARMQVVLEDARTYESQENSTEVLGPGSDLIVLDRFGGVGPGEFFPNITITSE